MRFEAKLMQVGNSLALIIPKALANNYHVKRGDLLSIISTDAGLFIPLKAQQLPSIAGIIDELEKFKYRGKKK